MVSHEHVDGNGIALWGFGGLRDQERKKRSKTALTFPQNDSSGARPLLWFETKKAAKKSRQALPLPHALPCQPLGSAATHRHAHYGWKGETSAGLVNSRGVVDVPALATKRKWENKKGKVPSWNGRWALRWGRWLDAYPVVFEREEVIRQRGETTAHGSVQQTLEGGVYVVVAQSAQRRVRQLVECGCFPSPNGFCNFHPNLAFAQKTTTGGTEWESRVRTTSRLHTHVAHNPRRHTSEKDGLYAQKRDRTAQLDSDLKTTTYRVTVLRAKVHF